MAVRRRISGLSLLEVLIVMAVVSIGLMGTMSVFYWGLRAGEEGSSMTQAINYSRDVLEAIRVRNLAFSGSNTITTDTDLLGRHPVDAAPLDSIGLPAGTKFERIITIDRLGTSGYQARVAVINVTVVWEANYGREKKAEIEGYASVQ